MALTTTSLAAAADAQSLVFSVTSATGATVGGFVRIDNEYSFITAISGTNITVRNRGDYGSKAVAHAILAPLTFGLASDLPAAPAGSTLPGGFVDNQSYGASGAIDVSLLVAPHTLITLNKASAAAMTLAAPSKAQDGIMVTISSNTAAAHTVTYTAGFNADTTSSDVATFAATKGNAFTIMAMGGRWGMVSASGVTLG